MTERNIDYKKLVQFLRQTTNEKIFQVTIKSAEGQVEEFQVCRLDLAFAMFYLKYARIFDISMAHIFDFTKEILSGKYSESTESKEILSPKKEKAKILNSLEYKQWRLSVFSRDGFKCRKCGGSKGNLEAHHIRSWANYLELRLNVDNGLTLCINCHKQTDTYLRRFKKEQEEQMAVEFIRSFEIIQQQQ